MANNKEMLVRQIKAKGIKSERVLNAMENVDRKNFVPAEHQGRAYADRPLPIGSSQTISQPYIVAYMTEKLEISPSDHVLEIGTGSGYQLAILKELTPHVYSIEKRKELAETAEQNLTRAGYDEVNIKTGDGYEGWEEYAPFDKIILTAAATQMPESLIEQLAPNGRMIAPIGSRGEVQQLVLLSKDKKEKVTEYYLEPVRFVPMV